MKNKLVYLVIIFFYSCSGTIINYNEEKEYIKVEKTDVGLESKKIVEVIYYKGEPYTGTINYFHQNGNINGIRNLKDGKKEGLEIIYNENGQLIQNSNFKKGFRDGHYEQFYENGQMMKTGNYLNDEMDGIWFFYDDDGKLKEKSKYINGREYPFGVSPEAYDSFRRAKGVNFLKNEIYYAKSSDDPTDLMETNNFIQENINFINKAIEIQPDFFEAYKKRARYKKELLEDIKGALLDYNKAIEIQPESIDVLLERAQIKKSYTNDYIDVLSDYNKAIELAIIKYNEIKASDPNSISEPKVYEGFNSSKTIDELFFERGELNLQFKNFNGALADFKKAIEFTGGVTSAIEYNDYYIEGMAAAKIGLGDTLGGIEDYLLIDNFLESGKIKLEFGDYNGALKDLNSDIKNKKEFFGDFLYKEFYYRGLVNKILGNEKESFDDFKKCINYANQIIERLQSEFRDYSSTGSLLGGGSIEFGLASIEIGDLDSACKFWKDELYNSVGSVYKNNKLRIDNFNSINLTDNIDKANTNEIKLFDYPMSINEILYYQKLSNLVSISKCN
tara:strand:- start:623 stop:2302 length:1680 start_codon:yes stop_codon:yes gene_type:complete